MAHTATIVGHSFVRRMRQELLDYPHNSYDTETDNHISRQLSVKLKINNCFSTVKTNSKFKIILDLPNTGSFICHDSLLVINIGSNDLANCEHYSPKFVEKLAEYIHVWGNSTGAKKVLFIGIIPRSKNLNCDQSVFEENRKTYNQTLKSLCRSSDTSDYKTIRGFERYSDRSLKSTTSWSCDGIHPTSMKRYARILGYHMMHATLPANAAGSSMNN